MPTLTINSKTALVGKDAKDFFDYIDQQKRLNVSFFKEGFSSHFHDGVISFKQDMLCENLTDQGNYTCSFIGKALGQGSFGTVYDIDKVMAVSSIEFRQNNDVPLQVVKKQNHCGCSDLQTCDHHNNIEMLNTEFQRSSKVGHLGIHHPILTQDERRSFTIMNKLRGTELFEILTEDIEQRRILSLQQRIELSLSLLQAAKTQIFDLNLIHLDIKPENIMVDLRTNPMTVCFLDYAFSQEIPQGQQGLMTKSHSGSLAYVAPEVIRSADDYFVTFSADLFSIMRILLLIWGGADYSYGKFDVIQYRSYIARFEHLNQLFKSIPSAQNRCLETSGINSAIIDILIMGLSDNPTDRGTLDGAIASFQSILDTYTAFSRSKRLKSDTFRPSCTPGFFSHEEQSNTVRQSDPFQYNP